MRKRRKSVLASIVCLVLCLAAASSLMMGVASSKQERIRVIIGFKEKPNADLVKGHDGKIRHRYKIIPAIACFLPEKAINVLRRHPRIAYVELDSEVKILDDTLDWGVDRIDAEIVWGGAEDATNVVPGRNAGDGIKIAIIDTGMDYNHPDLNDNYAGGYDFFNKDSNPMDDHGHGTHVAGIIAAEDNAGGVIGVAPKAELYALKALNSAGSGYVSDIVAAIDWAVAKGMQIISMSIGSNSDDTSFRTACYNAYSSGLLLVAAAGNDGYWPWGDSVDYPARYDSVIAVAATDISDARPYWSSRGPSVELAAPGVNIYSTTWDDAYATMSGTSMACPHVSGTAALVIGSAVDPAYDNGNGVWDASEVREKLKDTATDLGDPGRDNNYGFGLVNAAKAAPPTGPGPDTTPPKISNGEPTGKVDDATPILSVDTNEPATCRGSIDSDKNYEEMDFTFSGDTARTHHTHEVADALPDGIHWVYVKAEDDAGNINQDSYSWSFTVDTVAPVISEVAAVDVTHSSATITWSTDEPSDSNVVYGTDTPTTSVYEPGLVTSHSIVLTGLLPETTYVYEIRSMDEAGNRAVDDNGGHYFRFTTGSAPAVPTMHVESIDMSKETTFWGLLKRAKAVVTIFDADGKPVEGATVYGTWSGLTTQSQSRVTGSNGKVTFYTVWFLYITSGNCIFTVDDVTKTDWTYDPAGNEETSDSIYI